MSAGSAPQPPSDATSDDGAAALRDLPRELWHDLARVFRRAIEPLADGELPPALRPFRGWKPDRLLADRPRRAVADALGRDARLRERVGRALGDERARARLASLSLPRLLTEEGEGRAAALLVSAARWDDLATLAADVMGRRAAEQRAAAERRRRTPAAAGEGGHDLDAHVTALRRELDAARRGRDRAEARVRSLIDERDRLTAEAAALRQEVAALEASLRHDRAKHRDRLERLRRRAAEAQGRASVDDERIRKAAVELEQLAATLRVALGEDGSPAGGPDARGRPARDRRGSGEEPAAVPRSAPPADPGRPCRLPPGLTHENPAAVRSLLGVSGIVVVVDGYNVSKDPRGVGTATLPDQRRWLVRLAAGVAARYRVRMIVVFDSGEEVDAPVKAQRGVVVDFAAADETADDRIVGLVAGLDADQPVLVVTSDRDLGARCAALGADVVPSKAFLAAA